MALEIYTMHLIWHLFNYICNQAMFKDLIGKQIFCNKITSDNTHFKLNKYSTFIDPSSDEDDKLSALCLAKRRLLRAKWRFSYTQSDKIEEVYLNLFYNVNYMNYIKDNFQIPNKQYINNINLKTQL